jgi:Flp pilus assembly protein TadB
MTGRDPAQPRRRTPSPPAGGARVPLREWTQAASGNGRKPPSPGRARAPMGNGPAGQPRFGRAQRRPRRDQRPRRHQRRRWAQRWRWHQGRRWDQQGRRDQQGRWLRDRPAVGAAVAAGLLLVAVLAAAVPGLLLVGVLALVTWPVGGWVARRRAARRRLAHRSEAAPAVLDLLGAALLAGLNPHKAILRTAERAPEALHDDLSLAAAALRLGETPAAALRAAADRSGLDELRAAATALEAAERWGAPPAEALAARAEALRSRTRLHAEAEAGRAAVRLAFPLVLCFLPAFVLTNVALWL